MTASDPQPDPAVFPGMPDDDLVLALPSGPSPDDPAGIGSLAYAIHTDRLASTRERPDHGVGLDGGAVAHELLQGLDVEGRGALRQHERSGQADAPGCIDADLGHDPNLGQAPGRDRGVGGGAVPIALPA